MSKKNFDKRAIYFPLGCRKFIRRSPIERDETKRSLVTTDVAHIKTQVVNIEHKQEYVTDICTLNMNSRRRSKITSNESIYNCPLYIIHLLTGLRATSWVMLNLRTEMLPEASNWSIEYITLTGRSNIEISTDRQSTSLDFFLYWTIQRIIYRCITNQSIYYIAISNKCFFICVFWLFIQSSKRCAFSWSK